MRDDFDGNVGSSRSGQQQGDSETAAPLSQASIKKHSESQSGSSHDEHPAEIAEIEKLISQLEPSQAEQLLEGELILRLGQQSEWVGLLPPPDDFMKYPEVVQKHMVAWNDAQILDESKRADLFTQAFLRSKTRGQWMSFLINGIFTIAALLSFIITRDPASFGFLALPGINVVFNIWKSRKQPEDSEDL